MKLSFLLMIAPALLAGAAADNIPQPEQVSEISRMFLRDSAELPMEADVRTVVKDAKGKTKRDARSKVTFIFSGYSAGKRTFSFRSTAGFMSRRILGDSIAGSFAVINAFSLLLPHGSTPPDVTIERGDQEESFIVRAKIGPCSGFTMSSQFLYGKDYCYSAAFRVKRDGAGKLAVEDFTVDIDRLPAPGKVRYLGDTQIRRIHTDGSVQEATMDGEARPFLIPKTIKTTIETDKGTVVVTNDYALSRPVKK